MAHDSNVILLMASLINLMLLTSEAILNCTNRHLLKIQKISFCLRVEIVTEQDIERIKKIW